MDQVQTEQKLTSLVSRAVEIPRMFKEIPQIYTIHGEDGTFAERELAKSYSDTDLRIDSLLKVYIAFYLDTIPAQIVSNIKSSYLPERKTNRFSEYLVSVAGLLFEAKTFLLENQDTILPYLISYKEYLGDGPVGQVPDEDLVTFFCSQLESAIQLLINS